MAKKKAKKRKSKKKRKLTPKQRLFVDYYLQHWNATKAAEQAGYKGNRVTLASRGYKNIRKGQIREHIEERLSELSMGSAEVLARLADMARSFDMTKYIELKERFDVITKTDAKGKEKHYREFAGYVIKMDLTALQRDGHSHLIKKMRENKNGGIEIEWHDQMRVLIHLDNQYRPFRGKLDVTTEGKVTIIGFDADKV